VCDAEEVLMLMLMFLSFGDANQRPGDLLSYDGTVEVTIAPKQSGFVTLRS
jgi:hypothetical protein